MTDDSELLRCYAEDRDDGAFAELVRRHLSLVYHAALRQCGGDTHRAEDVAQTVFTDLARKAEKLARRPVLAGWLHTSTRYAAAQAVRTEVRRQAREQEAYAMNDVLSRSDATHTTDPSGSEWERVRPVIDEALHALGERDREAVLLRFFEGRAFAEIGAKLAVSEDAARMRVERALEKLRDTLGRRGVTSTALALGGALATQAGAAVPAELAATLPGAALAGVARPIGGTVAVGKFPFAVAAVVAVVTVALWWQQEAVVRLRGEVADLRRIHDTLPQLRAENSQLARATAEAAILRRDDAELARLQDEARALRERLQRALVVAPLALGTTIKVSVQGQIRRPGQIELSAGMVPTVKQVLAQVGGLTDTGIGSDIRVTRVSAEGLKAMFIVDTEGSLLANSPTRPRAGLLALEAGDIIYVPTDPEKMRMLRLSAREVEVRKP